MPAQAGIFFGDAPNPLGHGLFNNAALFDPNPEIRNVQALVD